MMENVKSAVLGLLVALSLVQSYFLAYSMPSLEARVKSGQDYVPAEPLGPALEVQDLLFPEQIVLHLGQDRHTVFFPDNAPYYDLILKKLQGRDFKGIQQSTAEAVNWDQVRREDQGLELRFGRPIPFQLLQSVFKIDADFLFSRDAIDRIWIFVRKDSQEVRTFFFSSDGRNVYEAQRADLTVGDVQTNVGFGEYWTPFQTANGQLYVPEKPYDWVTELKVPITRYTTEQMQRNLFFDPGVTRAIQEQGDGNRIYTDGKRWLKVAENGGWMSYTDPVAPTEGQTDLSDNVSAAVQFVNQHGGWNGPFRLTQTGAPASEADSAIRFQQYYKQVPIVPGQNLTFGYMELRLQQGTVTSYDRSLLILGDTPESRTSRSLPGGDALRSMVSQTDYGSAVLSLFPAYRPELGKDAVTLRPVWAVRLADGTVRILANASH
ncbi:YycH family regulatory protein [Cohnella caldifontis]|uniref:YycH family regulatory protein n=1 Tax=Cohnella caldifontis TaxID=3027471 RepID=UPI0023EDE4A2|nr:two-component system activity regulator YycH [Cohnella sp. YIM B05605]